MVCDMTLEEMTPENNNAVIDRMRWLSLHRCDSQIRTMKNGKRFSVLRVPLMCVALDQEKDGKFKCKDYENRPNICRNFFCGRAKQEGSYTGIPDQA